MNKDYLTFDKQSANQVAFRANEPPTELETQDEPSPSDFASLKVIDLSDEMGDDGNDIQAFSGNNSSAAVKTGVEKMSGQGSRANAAHTAKTQDPFRWPSPWVELGVDLLKLGTGTALVCLNAAIVKNNSAWLSDVRHCENVNTLCNEDERVWFLHNGFTEPLVTFFPACSIVYGGGLILDGVVGIFGNASRAFFGRAA